jgi:hypothetical protein
MKKKNENTTDNNTRKNLQKNKPVVINTNEGAAGKVKARAGRGTSNEGTNVSYDEER